MPARLQEKLMGFQREGIKFALKQGGRLLVGDEMGLGKTVQAIGIMACYRDEWPCIIITPSSLRGVPCLWLWLWPHLQLMTEPGPALQTTAWLQQVCLLHRDNRLSCE